MSTITKEWLQQKIAGMEATRDEIPFGLDEDDSNTLAALRIALASLEAEPIGAFLIAEQQVGVTTDYIKDGEWPIDDDVIEVYAAPPAPASVPDENGLLPCPCCGGKSEFDYDDDNLNWISCNVCGISTDTAYHTDVDAKEKLREVWNRRAAMLQSFGNSEQLNSPVIQDGWVACSERMPDETQPVITVAKGGVVQRTLYQFCDGVWSDWYDLYDYVSADAFTHWMPLPSPPAK